MPGTITFRSFCLDEKIAPKSARNSSGSRKLKNAALGLRQNILRSSRYWRQAIAAASGIGGQLQVDVLERGAGDAQALEAGAVPQRAIGQLVQQRRRVVGRVLDERAVAVAIGDPIWPGCGAEIRRGALDDDPPVLDDGHAIGQLLRLVEVVRGQ